MRGANRAQINCDAKDHELWCCTDAKGWHEIEKYDILRVVMARQLAELAQALLPSEGQMYSVHLLAGPADLKCDGIEVGVVLAGSPNDGSLRITITSDRGNTLGK